MKYIFSLCNKYFELKKNNYLHAEKSLEHKLYNSANLLSISEISYVFRSLGEFIILWSLNNWL